MSREENQFVRYFARLGHADEQRVRELYASIEDKSLVDEVLAKYRVPTGQDVHQPNLASYKYSTTATMEVALFFGGKVTLVVPSLQKKFVGTGGGPIICLNVYLGTFYYNNPDDLRDNSDFWVNFASLYGNCNIIRNGIYATFSGAAAFGTVGTGGGAGAWMANA